MTRVTDLASRVTRSDPGDPLEISTIREALLELRDLTVADALEDAGACLDAAAELVRFLPHLQEPLLQEGNASVRRLMALVSESLDERIRSQRASREATAAASSLVAPDETPQDVGMDKINDMLLGEIMVQLGQVTAETLEAALARQRTSGRRIGETLVEMGVATMEDVQRALSLQSHLSLPTTAPCAIPEQEAEELPEPEAALASEPLLGSNELSSGSSFRLSGDVDEEEDEEVDEHRLGEILVRLRYVTPDELQAGLRVQRATGMRLGEALVQNGAATWDQVRAGVELQKKHRNPPPPAPEPEEPAAPLQSTDPIPPPKLTSIRLDDES